MWTHWALLPVLEVCAVSNICMQTFCRPPLPRPAKARPCGEGVVDGGAGERQRAESEVRDGVRHVYISRLT